MRTLLARLMLALAGTALIATASAQSGEPKAGSAASAATDSAADSQREELAYALGLQAYTFGFPWVYGSTLRYLWTTQPRNPGRVPYMPLNQFYHARQLSTAANRDGGAPNNDTLYSVSWVDVGKEPMILSHPDMGDRYFSFEIASISSDNFAYVGKRATGSKAGHFAIVGPNWKGQLPPGVQALPAAPSRSVLVLGRTLVDGSEDLPAVARLQEQYTLTPLSLWGRNTRLPDDRNVAKPFDPATDPLAEWKTMNRALTEDPPPARHAHLMRLFATIGVGPGQDVSTMDAATQRGLARAAKTGRALLKHAIASGMGPQINGWGFPVPSYGRAGDANDFISRAALQSLVGIVANDPEESVYPSTFVDADRQPLRGGERYVIRFAPGQEPPVQAFWSLTVYGLDYNLVDNPINRYSIGDRTRGLKRDADGGLTIYVQSDAPEGDKAANWLPSPAEGKFFLVIRAYLPGPGIVDRTWVPPAVTHVGR